MATKTQLEKQIRLLKKQIAELERQVKAKQLKAPKAQKQRRKAIAKKPKTKKPPVVKARFKKQKAKVYRDARGNWRSVKTGRFAKAPKGFNKAKIRRPKKAVTIARKAKRLKKAILKASKAKRKAPKGIVPKKQEKAPKAVSVPLQPKYPEGSIEAIAQRKVNEFQAMTDNFRVVSVEEAIKESEKAKQGSALTTEAFGAYERTLRGNIRDLIYSRAYLSDENKAELADFFRNLTGANLMGLSAVKWTDIEPNSGRPYSLFDIGQLYQEVSNNDGDAGGFRRLIAAIAGQGGAIAGVDAVMRSYANKIYDDLGKDL